MMGSQERQREKLNQLKEQKMKSLKFFKPALATTLAIVLAWLLSVRPAEAGYTVILQQVGPDVVATGSGPLDLTGLSKFNSFTMEPELKPHAGGLFGAAILTGPTTTTDLYGANISGPTSFGSGGLTEASSGSGDMVGKFGGLLGSGLIVPTGYVSGTALSGMAIYRGKTFATLGVTPGTYVWTWGGGANQNFTLQIPPAINYAPTPRPRPTPAPRP
jgi:hypothetical protein